MASATISDVHCAGRIHCALFHRYGVDAQGFIRQVRHQPKLERPVLVSYVTPMSIASMTVPGRQGGRVSGGLGTTGIMTTTMPTRAGNG